MKKLIYTALIVLLTSSCAKKAVGSISTKNDAIQVDSLFTRAGCAVYRFHDAGHYVYYTVCRRNDGTYESRTSYTYSCGKGCSRSLSNQVVEQ